jgi:hypothetical protein
MATPCRFWIAKALAARRGRCLCGSLPAFNPSAMDIDFAFEPNGARGRAIDQAVRGGLADSLTLLFEKLAEPLGLDPASAARVIEEVRARSVAPGLTALYADLVEAVYADDEAAARRLARQILRHQPPLEGLRLLNLIDDDLGPGGAERSRRLVLAESQGLVLNPVTDARKTQIAGVLESALSLLAKAPDLFAETQALTRELILVSGKDETDDSFGGASTFYLWGALMLNAGRIHSRLDLALSIAHETAHAYLFGVNLGAPLSQNGPEDLCWSPLRADPRPVEGVFHATFVLARMIYLLDRLLESQALTAEEAAVASQQREGFRIGFTDGLSSLQPIARLTAKGARLLNSAAAYVDA